MSNSSIQLVLNKIFGVSELRGLIIGQDFSGKTSLLYRLKLGDMVTTIPTIGFNVETIPIQPTNIFSGEKEIQVSMWDVGGCDKIRPLWRHYFEKTQFIIWVVDSEGVNSMTNSMDFDVKEMIYEFEKSQGRVPILVLANKQDSKNAKSVQEIWNLLGLDAIKDRDMQILPISCLTGDGFPQILQWFRDNFGKGKRAEVKSNVEKKDPEKTLLEKWLEVEDEPDEEFLRKFRDYSLETWDHRTHLRIAWIYITVHGRKYGIRLIFDGIKNFIANSERTRKTTFNETMTYFWCHMVHYAIESSSTATSEFKQFLVLNPQLSNGGLFLEYYNKDTMLNNPKARSEVVLPDRKPLPSILPQKISNDVSDESKSNIAPMKKQSNLEMSEMEFMQAFENRTLDSWSHNNFVRVIWNVMKEYENAKSSGIPRSKFVDELFSKMQKFMKSDFHLTLTYFWIQIVHISMQTRNVDKFKEFWESSVHLHNQLFHQEFYSTLPIPSSKEMHLPDKKPFPKSL